MDGYDSTDDELDSDNEDELELTRWLKQLNEPLEVFFFRLIYINSLNCNFLN